MNQPKPETVRATAYLQVAPTNWRGERVVPEHARQVKEARVMRSTQKRAASPEPGTLEIKVAIDIPLSAFLPLRPEAVIEIPEGLTVAHPIVVEAIDPEEVA